LVLPPSCFCKCGSNFPNSTSLGQTWRWNFFPQMFVDWWFFSKHYPCYFLGNFDWGVFILCARIIWALYI
jgi:hypothetical protein